MHYSPFQLYYIILYYITLHYITLHYIILYNIIFNDAGGKDGANLILVTLYTVVVACEFPPKINKVLS